MKHSRRYLAAAAVAATLSGPDAHAGDLLTTQSVDGSAPYQAVVKAWLAHNDATPKIVGGAPASAGAFPWQVSLEVSWIANPQQAHFCGGSILSARWIVTAAHCVIGNAAKDIAITAGTHTLGVGGERHNVNQIIVRADYDPQTSDNDIALLELFDPLTLGPTIAAVQPLTATAEAGTVAKGTPLEVSGWGATVVGGKPVQDLRYVVIPFVDRADCNRPLAYDGAVSNNMICAGNMAGGQDACQGDSGGPLTVQGRPNPPLVGIVSWGKGCADVNKVGVYTRVANYAAWVSACTADTTKCQ